MQHARTPPAAKPSVITHRWAHAHVLLKSPLLSRLSPRRARRDTAPSPLVARLAAATGVCT
jgi:hypothetical protein